jgi:hypothetical protein
MQDETLGVSADPSPIGPGETGGGAKKSKIRWFIFGCAAAGVVGIVVLALGAGLFVRWGMGIFAEQVKLELRENPVILEHLGRLDTLEMDMTASTAAEDEDEFVFNAEGTKGSGVIRAICITRSPDREEVVSGTLELPDGSTYDLFPDGESGG